MATMFSGCLIGYCHHRICAYTVVEKLNAVQKLFVKILFSLSLELDDRQGFLLKDLLKESGYCKIM